MKQGPDVVRAEGEPWIGCAEEARDVGVGDEDALRLAGGAGGVDDVGEVIGGRCGIGIGVREAVACGGDVEALGGFQLQGCRDVAAGEHEAGLGVADDEGEAVLGIVRIEGKVGGAGLENGENADGDVGVALDGETDDVVALNAFLAQRVGKAVGPGIELPVGQPLLARHHRFRIRRLPHPGLKKHRAKARPRTPSPRQRDRWGSSTPRTSRRPIVCSASRTIAPKQRRHMPQPTPDRVRFQDIAVVVAFDQQVVS